MKKNLLAVMVIGLLFLVGCNSNNERVVRCGTPATTIPTVSIRVTEFDGELVSATLFFRYTRQQLTVDILGQRGLVDDELTEAILELKGFEDFPEGTTYSVTESTNPLEGISISFIFDLPNLTEAEMEELGFADGLDTFMMDAEQFGWECRVLGDN